MIYDTIKNYIEKEPRGRERKNKARALINILLVKYPLFKDIPKDKLINFCNDFNSYDRQWRLILSENVNLRGLDYSSKQELEENEMLKLGYSPNYQNNVKTLKNL